MTAKDKLLHAKVQSPLLIRKTLLEAAISLSEINKSAKELKAIKAEKTKKVREFKNHLEEMKTLCIQLEDRELPSVSTVDKEKTKKIPKTKFLKEELRKVKKEEKTLERRHGHDVMAEVEIAQLREKIRRL